MKTLILSLLVLSSLTAVASDETLLLDAACKVTCLVNVTEVANEGGIFYDREYGSVYADFMGLTREQMDKKTQGSELNKLCKKTFSEAASSESINCLYFKH